MQCFGSQKIVRESSSGRRNISPCLLHETNENLTQIFSVRFKECNIFGESRTGIVIATTLSSEMEIVY